MGAVYHHQETWAEGARLLVKDRAGAIEAHDVASESEATQRAHAVRAMLGWIGTPFRDCGFVKGPNGAVDCAMSLVGTYREAGLIGDFDPRPYPSRWFQHREEERFLDCLAQLGAHETDAARPGDILVWRFGRTYAHGAVMINAREVCHAYAAAGQVTVSAIDEPLLAFIGWRGGHVPRPVKYFTLWGR